MKRFSIVCIVAFEAALLIAGAGCQNQCAARSAKWESMFDGKTLNGWKRLGGEGLFYVENGAIVAKAVPDAASTFLCTEKNYGDFILEYDAKIDKELNSGVQIRSHVHEKDITTPYLSGQLKKTTRTFKTGEIWGYQIEIDPTPRAWSGGLYEEAGRGWLQHLADKPAAQKAFKNDQWNHFRVEAVGDHIKTWVNSVPAVDAHDSLTACGFIGLQLHYIYQDNQKNKTVRWRNIRIKNLCK